MNVVNILLIVFSFFYLLILSCYGADTITGNGYVTGDQTIVSATGLFELGFHKPGNTSNYYIAIWYKKIPGKPVSDKYTSNLRILNDGNIVLVTKGFKEPIWSTNLKYNSSRPVEAVLLDNGNLVIRDGSNPSSPLWQSFDHPTDTLMPDGKLGLNKLSKLSKVLTSWKNLEVPGKGLFSVERDPNANQFIMMWKRIEQYWTSGLWDPEQRIFSLVPELRFLKTQLYSFSYVDNENESYIIYSVHNSSIVTRLVMDVSGQLMQLTWLENSQQWVLFWSQPRQQCEAYSLTSSTNQQWQQHNQSSNNSTTSAPQEKNKQQLATHPTPHTNSSITMKAFMNKLKDNDIYMKLPEGFKLQEAANAGSREQYLIKLNRSLYGLKQSGRKWYNRLSKYLLREGYKNDPICPCIFVKRFVSGHVIIAVYVDDLNIIRTPEKISITIECFKKEFDMKDLGKTKCCLGLQIEHLQNGILVH
ncbi:G-type lectin S-receptor-like serine/threonine-protein kinase At2g19130 [Chenopodium quinoa]|uniref:G-type lectin S-receptor-like serine/threonine-protein kinase At2g19130 n=1 Tax=Chenopodium quinoa TaxID=63459 RepID=UPI000B790288|nr:G-type lectin S-receptor-like serine/threonine-protein kinase At2g19130 [Chenopodium quinoa]